MALKKCAQEVNTPTQYRCFVCRMRRELDALKNTSMLRANELQRVVNLTENVSVSGVVYPAGGEGVVLTYMGYIGMCRCKWYCFQ